MIKACPKCGAYYADAQLGFCLRDGTPLIGIDPSDSNWTEATRSVDHQQRASRKLQRKVRWRRLITTGMTMLVVTVVVCVVAVNGLISQRASIIGRVTDSGEPLRQIEIVLAGQKTASATTDKDGIYSFNLLPRGGNYTITPLPKANLNFTPSRISIDNLQQDSSADFFASDVVYKITGQVSDEDKRVGDVEIILSGAKSATTTTDASGNYFFHDLPPGGNYTVTAVPRSPRRFTRSSISIDNLTQDATADFHVQTQFITISGRVTVGNQPRARVKIRIRGSLTSSTLTDVNGYYYFPKLRAGRAYTITPDAELDLKPASKSFPELWQDTPVDFSATMTPPPVCTEADKARHWREIRNRFEPGWQHLIESEKPEIIAASRPPSLGGRPGGLEPTASLGRIDFDPVFNETCTSVRIRAGYEWKVHVPANAIASEKNFPISGSRRFQCEKSAGNWSCHQLPSAR